MRPSSDLTLVLKRSDIGYNIYGASHLNTNCMILQVLFTDLIIILYYVNTFSLYYKIYMYVQVHR